MSYSRCDRCYGDGQLGCPSCNTTGFGRDGYNFNPISALDGDAWDECDHCNGTGKIDCPECGGTGEVQDDD